MKAIRLLKAEEIELRVGTVSAKGCSLLLYKDARCDMQILDETFGVLGWQREHSRDNANCVISIWDKDNQHWVRKEDTGVESYTEKEKGKASDSFKRAAVNVGIGRELYTAPFIWLNCQTTAENGRYKLDPSEMRRISKMKVGAIDYDKNRCIKHLVIIDEKGNDVYNFGYAPEPKESPAGPAPVSKKAKEHERLANELMLCAGDKKDVILDYYKVADFTEMTIEQLQQALARVKK